MITIIHGEDTIKSRSYFLLEKKKFPDTIIRDGATLTLSEIIQLCEGQGLFSTQEVLFIENFFSKRKSGKELEKITSYIASLRDATIFFWEVKEITGKQLSLFTNAIQKNFKLPQSLFLFLDLVQPNNGTKLLTAFHTALESENTELLFFMLVRHVRILLALSSQQEGDVIDELKRMSPWQKAKLDKQRTAFTTAHLEDMHEKLYAIDLAHKTGGTPLTLIQSIDFFLLAI